VIVDRVGKFFSLSLLFFCLLIAQDLKTLLDVDALAVHWLAPLVTHFQLLTIRTVLFPISGFVFFFANCFIYVSLIYAYNQCRYIYFILPFIMGRLWLLVALILKHGPRKGIGGR